MPEDIKHKSTFELELTFLDGQTERVKGTRREIRDWILTVYCETYSDVTLSNGSRYRVMLDEVFVASWPIANLRKWAVVGA